MKEFFAKLKEELTKQYRVSFIDHETLYQYRQDVFKPITVLLPILVFLLMLVVGTGLFVRFAPIFQKEDNTGEKLAKMQKMLDERDQIIEEQLEAMNSMKRTLGLVSVEPIQAEPMPDVPSAITRRDPTPTTDDGALDIPDEIDEGLNDEAEESVDDAVEQETTAPTVVRTVYRPQAWVPNLFPPLKGKISNRYNEEKRHLGVDVAAADGSMIHAAISGYVIVSEYSEEHGYIVGISSDQNVVTFYKHNSRLLKEVGDYVVSGESIAVIGNTGTNSTGQHLHFELWHNGRSLDPLQYVQLED